MPDSDSNEQGDPIKRRLIVADVEPLDVDGIRTVAIGSGLWLLGFACLVPFYGQLAEQGRGWWLWACLAGFGLGMLGLAYCRVRRDRRHPDAK